MRNIVIEETMADMDTNRDGLVTLEEYISKITFEQTSLICWNLTCNLKVFLRNVTLIVSTYFPFQIAFIVVRFNLFFTVTFSHVSLLTR